MTPTTCSRSGSTPKTLLWQRVVHPHWQGVLQALVQRHVDETQSKYAAIMLHDWARALPKFWQVTPKEFAKYLPVPLTEVEALRA